LLSANSQTIWVWTWDASILIGAALWTAGYVWLVGPLRRRRGWGPAPSWGRQASFHLGTFFLLLALVSPLDYLSDYYLLSAHMVQHLLLVLVIPPLWLIGMPGGWLDDVLPAGFIQKAVFQFTRPLAAFLIFNVVFYAWHIPALYDAALLDERLHVLEHLMFLAVAVVGWWPVLGFLPRAAPRAGYPLQTLYLFLMMVFSTGLGAIISLAKDPLYPIYLNAPRVIGSTPLPAFTNGPRLWGLSIMDDQELAGLIMWVPGNMLFFSAFLLALGAWYRSEERKEREKYTRREPAGASDSERQT
jgi:putative membrane protein